MSRKNRKTVPVGRGRSVLGQCGNPGKGFSGGATLRFECLESRRLLSLAPIISEVDAGNKSGILDALGNTADWLEIYNPDPTAAVNLSGWSLCLPKDRQHDRQDVDLPQQRDPWSRRVPRGLLRLERHDPARRPASASWTRASISARTAPRFELINASSGTSSRRSPIRP